MCFTHTLPIYQLHTVDYFRCGRKEKKKKKNMNP